MDRGAEKSNLTSGARWAAAVAAAAAILTQAAEKLGEAGRRISPGAWRRLTAETLPRLAGEQAAAPPAGLGESLAAAMDALDRVEATQADLEAAAQTIGAPGLAAYAGAAMSQSFQDDLQLLVGRAARAVAEAGALRDALAKEAVDTWAARALPAADLRAAYYAAQRGAAAADLYVALLRLAPGGVAAGLLREMKIAAVGVREAGSADLHALQRLGGPPSTAVPTEASPASAGVVDLSLPGATSAVVYDLAPLVDTGAALKFGPIAGTTTGLNYTLVRRLKTIREVPVSTAAAGATAPACIAGPLLHTIDRASVRAFPPPVTPPWDPLAGPQPYVEGYQLHCARVALDALKVPVREGQSALRVGAPLPEALPFAGLLEQYGKAGQAELEAKAGSAATLARELSAGFERVFNARFPAGTTPTPGEFAAAFELDPVEATTPLYVLRAVAEVSREALEHAVLRPFLGLTTPQVPYQAVRAEAAASAALQIAAAGKKVARRIRDAYSGEDLASLLASPAPALAAVTHFQKTIAAAATRDPPQPLEPTLKLYALLRPAGFGTG